VRRFAPALLLCAVAGCELGGADVYEWDLPPGFPVPDVPEDNPMSEAKVELGRFLFYDPRLSGNETQSCASCHDQSLAFTDGRATAVGSTGEPHPRGSMSLANVAYNARLTWANPLLSELEDQALTPLFGDHPVELGAREDELLARLRRDPGYPAMFAEAFPDDADPLSVRNVVRALASFQRTLISGDSPYDRYVYQGDDEALSEAARRGLELFGSERLECFHCHGGFNFADGVTHEGTVIEEVAFHNTGLYNIDGRGGYPEPNRGVYEVTGDRRDMGHFRAPTLRNIAVTAPYMHDGSIEDLDGVLDHYAAGGRTIEEGPYAGVGSESPLKNLFIHGFTLTEQERADVLALLRSLTDETFLTDPRFSDPFAPADD
jgi:cytochrome c peroxidase